MTRIAVLKRMMKLFPKSISIIIIFQAFFICFFFCQKNQESNVAITGETEYPDQEGWNSTMTSTKDGVLTAVIRYGHMQRFKKSKEVEFDDGIEIDFYDDQGSHTSKLTSDEGKLNEGTNDIEAIKNVVVVSDSGINLKTEQIWWDNSVEKVVTDKFVMITTNKNDTLYGYGFESDQYLDNWSIRKVSGKAGRALDLGTEFKQKEMIVDTVSVVSVDSVLIDSTLTKKAIQVDTLKKSK
jgi:LPS export ABC transporter protein LptC